MTPDASNTDLELSVSEFVALHNHVLEYTMPSVVIVGELSSFRVSKNRWVYFDLKDETASVKFFGTVYQLSGPLEDGMVLRVQGTPRVHPLFGFSITITSIQLAGAGTIHRAFDLLQQKLTGEGLFDPARKRQLPYPPQRIGIITSKESAAYADICKVLAARWGGIEITVANVQVQGEIAPAQIAEAVSRFNQLPEPPEVLVVTRGGGSLEDLQPFNTELVTRAIAGSRIPTLVAIGHEVDTSLAELAADVRASTPSNAAELLVPDKKAVAASLNAARREMAQLLSAVTRHNRTQLGRSQQQLEQLTQQRLLHHRRAIDMHRHMLALLNPSAILARGYAIVRATDGQLVRSADRAIRASQLKVTFNDGTITVEPKES